RALLRIPDRGVERGLRDTDGPRRDVDASGLEAVHHLCEAVTLFAADEVGPRNPDVVEDQLVRVDRTVSELVDVLRDAEAVRLRDEQTRHPAMRRFDVRIRLHDRREDRSVLAVRDEHLAAPDDVLAVRPLRDGADGLEVAPAVRL